MENCRYDQGSTTQIPLDPGRFTYSGSGHRTGDSTAHPASSRRTGANSATLPADQVWQCEVNGQKVFSDKRCGASASIRQLNAVNGMDAPLPLHAPRYAAGSGAGPGYARAPGYAPSQSYDSDSSPDADNPNEVYAANQYFVIDERRRREHHAPPHLQHPQTHPAVHAHATR